MSMEKDHFRKNEKASTHYAEGLTHDLIYARI